VDGFIVPQPAPECKVPAGKNHDRLPKTFALQKHDRMHKKQKKDYGKAFLLPADKSGIIGLP
jgi:hypothetical protein